MSAQTFEIVAVDDFDQAMEKANGDFDLVLLDFDMPGMNGLFGLDQIKDAVDIPVAILSGTANRAIAQDALDRSAAGFLPKTVDPRRYLTPSALLEPERSMPRSSS